MKCGIHSEIELDEKGNCSKCEKEEGDRIAKQAKLEFGKFYCTNQPRCKSQCNYCWVLDMSQLP